MTAELPVALADHCPHCGDLAWTLGVYDRTLHKHECPNRTDACQTHPRGCPTRRASRLPLVPIVVAFGALIGVGVFAAVQKLPAEQAAGTITTRTLRGDTETRTIRKITEGQIITLPGGIRVIHVPAVVIHAAGRLIRVPAHNLPFRVVGQGGDLSATTVAEPLVPVTVTVYVPTTVYIPTTITETLPAVTITTTIPTLPSGSDPSTSRPAR
jgi:hypothetical protein